MVLSPKQPLRRSGGSWHVFAMGPLLLLVLAAQGHGQRKQAPEISEPRSALAAAGFTLETETKDEGGNHYYFATKQS